ncbi:MAG: signal peptidase II [Deltaproteobacteria bacterium]|nr:signal peptidase II [Deltaproteobacteria bacterium]
MFRFFAIMMLVVGCDQLSKVWILQNFELYESTVIIPGLFNLTFLRNTGAAFGMFAGHAVWWRQLFFIGVAVIALVVILVMQRRLGRQNSLYTISLGFIGGGAIGNLIDRILYGSVVDFLDVYIGSHHWPAFNVADSAICVGVGIFLFTQFSEDRQAKREQKISS